MGQGFEGRVKTRLNLHIWIRDDDGCGGGDGAVRSSSEDEQSVNDTSRFGKKHQTRRALIEDTAGGSDMVKKSNLIESLVAACQPTRQNRPE